MHSSLKLTAVGIITAGLLSGCSLLPEAKDTADGYYPQAFDSPYGSTTVESTPKTVVVTSSVDLDLALSLGVTPVLAPGIDGDEISPWAKATIKDKGLQSPQTYDGRKGPDLDAIAEAKPDLILATGLDSVSDDYTSLSKIAPTIASAPEDVWTDRVAAVATALDQAKAAHTVVKNVTDSSKDVAASHLEFEDTTYTIADVRKKSISYLSYNGSDQSFFTGLGMYPATEAEDFSAKKHSVKREDVQDLDADVLLIHFPDKDNGMLAEAELADPYYREVRVIRGRHYTVLDDDTFTALTNLSPLSIDWLLDDFPAELRDAEQGILPD